MAGRQLALNLNELELAELDDWLVRLGEAASKGDMTRYFSLNLDFHDRMIQMTKNATLLEFYRLVIGRMHLMRRRNFSVVVGIESSHAEHRAILEALKTRDPLIAGMTMRNHVIKAHERLASLLRRQTKREIA